MILQETRSVSLAFALRPDDISTGRPVWPGDASLCVLSGDGLSRALPKDDGYFIFTGARPDSIRLMSKLYEGFHLPLGGFSENILRVFLAPKNPKGPRFSLPLEPGQCAHIGFYTGKAGYVLSGEIEPGSPEITLNKDDYAELSGLFHALVRGDGTACHVLISDNLGYGRYRLSGPFPPDYPIRGTRLLPLYRVVGNGGNMHIPVPEGCHGAYLLLGRELRRITTEEWS